MRARLSIFSFWFAVCSSLPAATLPLGGSFDQAIELFDLDFSGAFNVAPGAPICASPKGAGWTQFTPSQVTEPL